jgi:hypothetical protein
LAGRLSDDCSSVDCSAGSEDYRKIQLRAISISDILSTLVGFLSDAWCHFVFAPASVLSWRRQAAGGAAERPE